MEYVCRPDALAGNLTNSIREVKNTHTHMLTGLNRLQLRGYLQCLNTVSITETIQISNRFLEDKLIKPQWMIYTTF